MVAIKTAYITGADKIMMQEKVGAINFKASV